MHYTTRAPRRDPSPPGGDHLSLPMAHFVSSVISRLPIFYSSASGAPQYPPVAPIGSPRRDSGFAGRLGSVFI